MVLYQNYFCRFVSILPNRWADQAYVLAEHSPYTSSLNCQLYLRNATN
jgi:hypothetical protein